MTQGWGFQLAHDAISSGLLDEAQLSVGSLIIRMKEERVGADALSVP
jgi:hypothetical protein